VSTFSIKICKNDLISLQNAICSFECSIELSACCFGYYMLSANQSLAGNMYLSFIFSFFSWDITEIKAD